jgi:hypothetical protein
MKLRDYINNPFTVRSNLILLILITFLVFVIPFFPRDLQPALTNVFFSLIFLSSIFALETWRQRMITIAIVGIMIQWISHLFEMPVLIYVSSVTNILFYQIIVIRLIIQVARSRRADASMILQSVNGYLMMGVMFSTWVALAMTFNPNAFLFSQQDPSFTDFTYFTFITMTTVGYGDITPQLPFARSISILISTSGQIYIAVIIAMLVGKYSSKAS